MSPAKQAHLAGEGREHCHSPHLLRASNRSRLPRRCGAEVISVTISPSPSRLACLDSDRLDLNVSG
jgi:hypothetical protein